MRRQRRKHDHRDPELRRVLLVHPSAELYGSDRVAYESARAFLDAGSEVTVVLGESGPLEELLRDAGCPVSVLPAPVLRKSYLSPWGLLRFGALTLRRTGGMIAALRRIRPQVVYVSTVTVPWWLVLARLTGSRVLCHVHEAEADVPRLLRLGLAAPLLLAHRVVANSQVSKEVLVSSLPRLARRIEVVYNGVPGPAEVVPPRERVEPPLRLVLVGRISPRKGTDVAVKALALLREQGVEATLDLVGGVFPGYEWFEEEVRGIVEERGLGSAVRWQGVQPQVWESLADADIALVPSRVEPFGNAAVEAMLAGRPVIAGDAQGLREIVIPGENGRLARAGDEIELAATVQAMVQDWAATLVQADRARETAEQRFSPVTYRSRIAEVLVRT